MIKPTLCQIDQMSFFYTDGWGDVLDCYDIILSVVVVTVTHAQNIECGDQCRADIGKILTGNLQLRK